MSKAHQLAGYCPEFVRVVRALGELTVPETDEVLQWLTCDSCGRQVLEMALRDLGYIEKGGPMLILTDKQVQEHPVVRHTTWRKCHGGGYQLQGTKEEHEGVAKLYCDHCGAGIPIEQVTAFLRAKVERRRNE